MGSLRYITTLLLASLNFVTSTAQQNWKELPPLFAGQQLDNDKILHKIAFGSCNHQDLDQQIWEAVNQQEPEIWIWGGDNIYGDTEDMETLYDKYFKQKNNPSYRKLREKAMILGIWDDHDYGVNDGNKGYRWKRESKDLMMDFLDVPKESACRRRDGVYQSQSFGPEGKKVKVILLDGRWFKDFLRPAQDGQKGYQPNETGDVLGEAQWKWLESELTDSDAQVHIIVSGFQIISNQHHHEKWGDFPEARKRLFRLIEKTAPANLLLLSGDRHLAELSRIDLPGLHGPLFELTSSGMTHTEGARDKNILNEKNPHRVGPQLITKNFALLTINWEGERPAVNASVYSYLNELLFSFDLPTPNGRD